MKWAGFNLNDSVRFKVTPHGEEARRRHYERLGLEPPPLRRDADGWITDQLWSVMQLYGPAILFGGPIPIETTIQFAMPDDGG